jgi:Na+/H+-dicarboxylate symporter
MASVGVAGLPGSGLIILQLVLKAAGLPDEAILVAFPLIQGVDWILARVRSAVNVLGDMQVAILLDRGRERSALHREAHGETNAEQPGHRATADIADASDDS